MNLFPPSCAGAVILPICAINRQRWTIYRTPLSQLKWCCSWACSPRTPCGDFIVTGSKPQLQLLKKFENKVKGLMTDFHCWNVILVIQGIHLCRLSCPKLTRPTSTETSPCLLGLCLVWCTSAPLRLADSQIHLMPSYLRTEFKLSRGVCFGRRAEVICEGKQSRTSWNASPLPHLSDVAAIACTDVIEMQ